MKNSKFRRDDLSPMLKQCLATQDEYPDCILFYRLGDFYEMFFEDAIVCSKELDLTLTGKDCGIEGERVPMCGVPYHAYESYVQKLLEKGYKVAICEQTNDMVGKLVKREVIRVITPGTVIDSSMLKDNSNSYIMCIYKHKNTISYAYGDMSTGEVCVAEYDGEDLASYINDQIIRIMPAEIICNNEAKELSQTLPCAQTKQFRFGDYHDWAYLYSNAENCVLKQYNLDSLKGHDFATKSMIVAVGAMISYFNETQKRELKHLKMPKVIKDNQFMYIDTNTRRNLEIEQSMHGNSKHGSLLWVLDKTNTSGGARMLKSWVRQPLQDKQHIDERLDMVASLFNNELFLSSLEEKLNGIQDIERLAGKIAYGNLTPKDCIALATSLSLIPDLKSLLLKSSSNKLVDLASKLMDISEITNLLFSTISDKPPATMKEGGFIREGVNQELDHFRNIKSNAENIILEMQAREKEKTGIKNLKIGYNRVFGYYIEISKLYSEQVPIHYIRKQTISNNERYITEELKKFEDEVLSSTENALRLEQMIFDNLKTQLLSNIEVMQQIASTVSVVDCVCSFARVALENDYVRPNIVLNKEIRIDEGRHPVVEKLLKSNDFISNDCLLNDSDQRTMILTGPNMAGKSTYMRQVALITYLAHIGSFVPAQSADICIVDRIFTRIGASDDLAVGQSTFMVEMIEVANILHNCTNNSLIILDEVGRGTSTFDGLSIAWAVVEYLSKQLKAKTLFATHYHELMNMEGSYEGVKNFCISIKELGGRLVFLRKIMRGGATKSYGVEVASLAGLPQTIIDRAKQLMVEFEQGNANSSSNKESEIISMLKEIDINRLSPLVAFDTLSYLIEKVK